MFMNWLIQFLEWWIPKCSPKKTKGVGGSLESGYSSSANFAWTVTTTTSWGNTNLKGKTFRGNH